MTAPKLPKNSHDSFPTTQAYDDFLDFSLMRLPPSRTVATKRLLDNLLRFSGNYTGVWMVSTLTWGLFANWRMLGAIAVVGACGFGARVVCVNGALMEGEWERGERSRSYKKEDAVISSVAKQWFLVFSIFVMYATSTLFSITMTIIAALSMASAHAIMRPIVNEYYFVHQPLQPKKRPSVIHSDGFVDNEQEDEVAFEKENDDPSSTVRRRSLEGKGNDS